MSSTEFSTVLPEICRSTSAFHHPAVAREEVTPLSRAQQLDADVDSARGKLFTSLGPPEYKGKGILEDPELLWLDDTEWDEERVKEAIGRITIQGDNAPQFWRDKYVRDASKYWHIFYKRNTDHFYKDRHYLHVVFPELLTRPLKSSIDGRVHLLEVGCGVGNAILPLPELNPFLTIHAIDFAASAIKILQANPQVMDSKGTIIADVCDVVHDEIPVDAESQDLVLCMFVLSAIAPQVEYRKIFTFLHVTINSRFAHLCLII